MNKFLTCLLLPVLLFSGAAAAEETPAVPSGPPSLPPSLERFSGESLRYDIAFLWFNRLADGLLAFGPGEEAGTWQAVLEAQTLGVASWLTGNRAHRYVSVMAPGPEGKLRSLSHESHVLKGPEDDREDRIKRYLFDYQSGEVLHQKIQNGEMRKEEVLVIERQNPPVDILTAFYNLRAGFYGPLLSGATIRIPTFSHKGISDIVVEVIPEEERDKYSFFPKKEGILARVTVDPEIFDTGGGNVYVWFDEGRPARGIVENVIGLGNVRGTMR